MDLQSILTMLGGIGLFLYGMKLMGQSLERFAGAKMEKTLERLTSSRGKGVLLGAGVTAVIQSSSATIIMVIGFLNAGILKPVSYTHLDVYKRQELSCRERRSGSSWSCHGRSASICL